jgi:hypothetical protein
MSGDHSKIWLLVIGFAAAAAYSFWYAFKSWANNRAIADTPTSRVRSAAQGYVELSGRGILPPDSHTKGPLTGLPCTWWRYKIEERGNRRGWTTVDSGTSTDPFVLDDGTGQCLVDPRGAEVFPDVKNVWYGPDAWPQGRMPDGVGVLGWLVDHMVAGKYRYTEHRLQAREHVCALGEFRSHGGISANNPDDEAAALLHEWKQDQANLLSRFDADHDGKLCAAEWEQARAAARKQVIEGRSSDTRVPSLNVLADPGDGRSFLLAASDGRSLAQRFRHRALAALVMFVCCSAASAFTWTMTRLW